MCVMCIYVYVCIYICMHIYIYIFKIKNKFILYCMVDTM